MPKKRILVVDDSEDITAPLKLYLERTGGFEVRVENRGAHAVAAARAFQPDLILLDVVMPDMDGGDIAAQLEDDPQLKTIDVVLLTANVTKREASVEGGAVGGRPMLSKMTTLQEIIDFIKTRLGS